MFGRSSFCVLIDINSRLEAPSLRMDGVRCVDACEMVYFSDRDRKCHLQRVKMLRPCLQIVCSPTALRSQPVKQQKGDYYPYLPRQKRFHDQLKYLATRKLSILKRTGCLSQKRMNREMQCVLEDRHVHIYSEYAMVSLNNDLIPTMSHSIFLLLSPLHPLPGTLLIRCAPVLK